MSKIKIETKQKTFEKIGGILNASKLKVLNRMSNIKAEATHNIMTALLSKNIFEFAKKSLSFSSDVYTNKYKTENKINVVFLQEKQTLSYGYERIINKLFKDLKKGDLTYIVIDFKLKDDRLSNFNIIKGENINSLAQDIILKYTTKNFKEVIVYSGISSNGYSTPILPMENLEIIKGYKYENFISDDINFQPSIDVVIESSYNDYARGLMKYFYINSKYTELKNTLIKHESSINHISDKLNELEKMLNKLRQSKITEEILISFSGGGDD